MTKRVGQSGKLKVVELFAGVGGFRVGLDRASAASTRLGFETIWANQWEPGSDKHQHAAWVYEKRFFRDRGICDREIIDRQFSNIDIEKVVDDPDLINQIPDHDLLTGGFPCQDYSVARPKSQAVGLVGKKGVLWWSIYKILKYKKQLGTNPRYIFLENVDRLLKSPTSNRGRDFAIMLSCLNELDYIVEWRVVNAGDYGFPQRRRRTFLLGYRKDSEIGRRYAALADRGLWTVNCGTFAKAFPVQRDPEFSGRFTISDDPVVISSGFAVSEPLGVVEESCPFQNAGTMIDGIVTTAKVRPEKTSSGRTLGDVIKDTNENAVDARYYILNKNISKWEGQKGAHKFERTSKSGHAYMYAEGAIPFPDYLDRPSRTIITSEGGSAPSRFKHVIDTSKRKGRKKKAGTLPKEYSQFRRLTPEELEDLCMFDRGHTKEMYVPGKAATESVSDNKRAFFMGNALVVGAIERVGRELLRRIENTEKKGEQKAKKRQTVAQ